MVDPAPKRNLAEPYQGDTESPARNADLVAEIERLRLALGARNTEAELIWIEENERLRRLLIAHGVDPDSQVEIVGEGRERYGIVPKGRPIRPALTDGPVSPSVKRSDG